MNDFSIKKLCRVKSITMFNFSGQSLNLLNDVVKFWALTILPFEKMFLQKLVNLGKLCKDKTMDFYLIKYLPGMTKISRHGQIYNALTKK